MLKISLWRTQLCNVTIWNADEFRIYLHATYGINLDKYLLTEENDDLIFFSGNICGASHSDVDGDHSSIQTLDQKGQELLREFYLSDVCESEITWTQDYIEGEFDSNLDLVDKTGKLLPVSYKLHNVPMESYKVGRDVVMTYSDYFFQSLEAKVNVGSSTNDSWVFAMLLEAYSEYAKANNYCYEVNNETVQMVRLNRKKFFDYHSAYIRGLQDFVVSAIKHSDNGSDNFENLFLKNMADENNRKKVFSLLVEHLKLSPNQANEILRIVTWAAVSGIYSACSSFLRLYNKGTVPWTDEQAAFLTQHEHFVHKNTYFGRLMQPVYDVIQMDKERKGVSSSRRAEELEALLAAL